MGFGLLNLVMLFGLIGLAIPVIIHLLNRRRFDVIDWGAMRFLQMSETTRRRVFIEELLLMLLRMGLILLLVVAMCAPFASSSFLTFLAWALGILAVVLVVLFLVLAVTVSGFDPRPFLVTVVLPLALLSGFLFVFQLSGAENRDVVLVFDGSTAMSYTDDEGKTAHERAVEWSKNMLDDLT